MKIKFQYNGQTHWVANRDEAIGIVVDNMLTFPSNRYLPNMHQIRCSAIHCVDMMKNWDAAVTYDSTTPCDRHDIDLAYDGTTVAELTAYCWDDDGDRFIDTYTVSLQQNPNDPTGPSITDCDYCGKQVAA